jgi:hypothetical protein
MSKERTYTREEFELAVRETLSVRETLLRLGLVAQGGGPIVPFTAVSKSGAWTPLTLWVTPGAGGSK